LEITRDFRPLLQSGSARGRYGFPPTLLERSATQHRLQIVIAPHSALQRGADGAVMFPLVSGDRLQGLVVMGAPMQMHNIRWGHPDYSIYRCLWMAQFKDATSPGFQPNMPSPVPNGRRHPNGRGRLAPNAVVDASAFVGPNARVLGRAVRGNSYRRLCDRACQGDHRSADVSRR
jgi:hypothetical protein